jgi:uncharacterized cupredoxin-like copper-binding protein
MNLLALAPAAAALALWFPATLHAHGGDPPAARVFDASKVEPTPFGQEGDPQKVTRTIRVRMDDRMRFVPSTVNVKRGETVRFVVANEGAVLHEMVIGTPRALKEHAELMKKHPGMEHDEPHMAHVKPGAAGEIVWQFTRTGAFQFACLVPGHFDAGMVGKVVVK